MGIDYIRNFWIISLSLVVSDYESTIDNFDLIVCSILQIPKRAPITIGISLFLRTIAQC